LENKGKGGGEVVLAEQVPRRGPNLEGPSGIEEIVDPATNNPREESSACGGAVASRVKRKPRIPEGEEKPDDESIEEGTHPADDAEAEDADNLLLGKTCRKSGLVRTGRVRNHEVLRMAKNERIGNWLERMWRGSV
jgi:hypothetical protein